MSEHQHTPGPWSTNRDLNGQRMRVLSKDFQVVAIVSKSEDHHLIAAAPELMDACNQFMAAISQSDDAELRNAINSARKAVNKAAGK